MTRVVRIIGHGTLALPNGVRQPVGIPASGQMVVEKSDGGLLLRPRVTVPVEIYSAKRLAEFERNNDMALSAFKLKR